MIEIQADELLKLAIPLASASGGMAWAGVKLALNGTRKRMDEIKATVHGSERRIDERLSALTQSVDCTRLDLAYLQGQLGVAPQHVKP